MTTFPRERAGATAMRVSVVADTTATFPRNRAFTIAAAGLPRECTVDEELVA